MAAEAAYEPQGSTNNAATITAQSVFEQHDSLTQLVEDSEQPTGEPKIEPYVEDGQEFGVDENGNGKGRIVSANGDIYKGEFSNWKRHGLGTQLWASGESFEGQWGHDIQLEGVFVDNNGRRWAGNFKTRNVQLLEEQNESADQGSSAPAQKAARAKGSGSQTHRSRAARMRQQRPNLSVYTARRHKDKAPPSASEMRQRQKLLQTLPFSAEAGRQALAKAALLEDGLILERSSRFGLARSDTPGPGAYNANFDSTKAVGPRFSLAKQLPGYIEHDKKLLNASPGPMYFPSMADKPRVATAMFKMKHEIYEKVMAKDPTIHESPGPGTYNNSIGRVGNEFNNPLNNLPENSSTFGSANKSRNPMGQYLGKQEIREIIGRGSPGPATYFPESNGRLGKDMPSYTMHGRPSFTLGDPENQDGTVGPGSHDPDRAQFIHPRGHSQTFSKSVKIVAPTENIRQVQYLTHRHIKENRGHFAPGPGTYNPSRADAIVKPIQPPANFKPHPMLRFKHAIPPKPQTA